LTLGSLDRLLGSLLAGAVGDALGAPLEFIRSRQEIETRFGPGGPDGFVTGAAPAGSITDDTQMTLFTAEGIIRARTRARLKGICHVPSVIRHAYHRWLFTQGERVEGAEPGDGWPDGWLVQQRVLHARRAPGLTCVNALRRGGFGTPREPLNDSKGCGGVMRMAPAGVLAFAGMDPFDEGCAYAAITHGHPTGWLAAGAFATIVAELLQGRGLTPAVDAAVERLRRHPKGTETRRAIDAAVEAAGRGGSAAERLETLGEGWVAEEALAISLYCALVAPDLRRGLRLAVNHGGDSDSTGSIAGNLLGAMHGVGAIPPDLLAGLEARDVVERVASDLHAHVVEQPEGIEERDWERYPGW
jgi:ADP-ribosylglycohydrolase